MKSHISKHTTSGSACQAKSQNRTGEARVELYADILVVRTKLQYEQKGGGKRGKCKGFSDDSRRRMMQRLAMLNLRGMYTYFVTLTYPGEYVQEWEVWKRDLEVIVKHIARKYDNTVGLVWRVEFQKRGAPHYHMILICDSEIKDIQAIRQDMSRKWAKVVLDSYMQHGQKKEEYEVHYRRHIQAGTRIDVLDGRKRVVTYISKYIAKVDDSACPEEWGRSYGFRNLNGELDFSPVEVIYLEKSDADVLRRLVRNWMRSRGSKVYSRKMRGKLSYSALGLGADSSLVAYRMLRAVVGGLLAPHISPELREVNGEVVRLAFIDRVKMERIHEGDKILTPAGIGEMYSIRYCDILHRMRCSAFVEKKGYMIYDLREVREYREHVFEAIEAENVTMWNNEINEQLTARERMKQYAQM